MTRPKSNRRPKPAKPHPDYPLFAHACGQWAKKVHGKIRYFGKWDSPDAALRHWLAVKDELLAGHDPLHRDQLTIADLVNAYLDSKQAKVDAGDMAPRSFDNYHKACRHVVEYFGRGRLVSTLQPADFTAMRKAFPATWGARSTKNRIDDIKRIFAWAYKQGHVDQPVRFGENFTVAKKAVRIERKRRPKQEFTAKEVHRIIAAADTQLAAMVMLGLNGGFGPKEVSDLRRADIDGEWIDTYREKTAVDRRVWLWKETRDAIALAQADRPHVPPGDHQRVFLTVYGQPWVDGAKNGIARTFGKAKRSAGCHRDGVGFRSLRHMFQTIAENAIGDLPAIRRVMGHVDPTIQADYRESIDDARIRRVCGAVRDWLYRPHFTSTPISVPKSARKLTTSRN